MSRLSALKPNNGNLFFHDRQTTIIQATDGVWWPMGSVHGSASPPRWRRKDVKFWTYQAKIGSGHYERYDYKSASSFRPRQNVSPQERRVGGQQLANSISRLCHPILCMIRTLSHAVALRASLGTEGITPCMCARLALPTLATLDCSDQQPAPPVMSMRIKSLPLYSRRGTYVSAFGTLLNHHVNPDWETMGMMRSSRTMRP
nr:hypothetical protein CFP56_11127 [Quercus suber]